MTQKIKPTYVTFEQAKLLKEKGFNKDIVQVECNQGYDFRGDGINLIKNGRHIQHELFYSAPEQWQVVEWLRVNYGIWVYTYSVAPFIADDEDYPKIVWVSKVQKFEQFDKFIEADNGLAINHHRSPQEAYSAAFDYILNNDLI